ncbi:hypothetical protein Pse7429DRAFT_0207 [Pseudanabaena biceps PCC 7429]|uniref:Uncharacterized protein n=1 Tax=Pseudanabaena biceps PCC 7429 TaxID=927668 RepID=L8N4E4_9CYAN|nr:hypothetical protein Pse7429DRAFT_0207 [Pseudanabaena biceps PCC 7429]
MATPFLNLKNLTKYLGAIKYKTPKAVAHAQRALQLLTLVFNYANLLFVAFFDQKNHKKLVKSVALQHF